MKQHKISNWLKGLDIILALMLLAFFIGATIAVHMEKNVFYSVSSQTIFIASIWYTAICCFIVLLEFWKVCTQIGLDNSFSIENSHSFRHMAVCGIAASVGFVIRLIWLVATDCITPITLLVILTEIIIGLMFAVLAEAMSQLVFNAYEVKHENDLTI